MCMWICIQVWQSASKNKVCCNSRIKNHVDDYDTTINCINVAQKWHRTKQANGKRISKNENKMKLAESGKCSTCMYLKKKGNLYRNTNFSQKKFEKNKTILKSKIHFHFLDLNISRTIFGIFQIRCIIHFYVFFFFCFTELLIYHF